MNYIHKNIELRTDFIKNDVLLISQNHELINFIATGSNNSYTAFTNFLLLHIQSLQIYDQIKYINASGYENVRVNFNGSSQNSYIVSPTDLEDKFQRNYFNETYTLNQGNIFVSTIDLTVTNGTIEVPYVPVIHFGAPVFDENMIKKGIIITNYLVSDLFRQYNLINKDPNQKQFYLLDYQGNYIINQNSSKLWGHILNSNINFAFDNPSLWNQILRDKNESVTTSISILEFYTFSVFDSRYYNLENPDYFWIALISYNNQYLQNLLNQTFQSLLSIMLNYYLLFLTLGLLISYVDTKRKFNDIASKEKEREQNELIKSTNLLLKKQKKELSEFAHTMNHDIRNYLTIINQYIELIDTKNPNLDAVKINLDKIDTLLHHSLKLAESGLIIDDKKKVNIGNLINELKLTFPEVQIESKGVLPNIMGDEEKVIQMLTNIVSNNIIHGKASLITFEGEFSGDGKYFLFKIKNDGDQIKEIISDKIFTKGFTTKKEGNGLGLYIAQKIANSHGWYIKLTDLIHVTFSITIPVGDVISSQDQKF